MTELRNKSKLLIETDRDAGSKESLLDLLDGGLAVVRRSMQVVEETADVVLLRRSSCRRVRLFLLVGLTSIRG